MEHSERKCFFYLCLVLKYHPLLFSSNDLDILLKTKNTRVEKKYEIIESVIIYTDLMQLFIIQWRKKVQDNGS